MKNLMLSFSLLFLVIALSACGSTPAAAPTTQADQLVSGVYTAVAGTVAAQVTPISPTTTPLPSATPTLQPSPTPTLVSPTALPQVWYWWPTATETETYSDCNDSSLVKDVTIPDETVMAPGETFVKTWRFKNTGSCDWASDYLLVFVKGNAMDGSSDTIGETVDTNTKTDLSVTLTAPDDDGTYIGYWELADDDGYTFGERVYVRIVVEVDEATNTPTSTRTPTATATATSVPSVTPTITLAPTQTGVPTSTLQPTLTSAPSATSPSTSTSTALVYTKTPQPTETPVPTLEPGTTFVPSATPMAASSTPAPTEVPAATSGPTSTTAPASTETQIPATQVPTEIPTSTSTPMRAE